MPLSFGACCGYKGCDAVFEMVGEVGILVVPTEVLKDLDLSQPLDLAALPLERWVHNSYGSGSTSKTPLSHAEVDAVLPDIDYAVITANLFYISQNSPLEAALAQNPALKGMRSGEVVRLALAPLQQPGQLSFAALEFDFLDLWLSDRMLGMPIAMGHLVSADNGWREDQSAVAIRAICARQETPPEYFCMEAFE